MANKKFAGKKGVFGALLLLLQGIASLIDSAMILAGYKEPEAPAEEDITKENL